MSNIPTIAIKEPDKAKKSLEKRDKKSIIDFDEHEFYMQAYYMHLAA